MTSILWVPSGARAGAVAVLGAILLFPGESGAQQTAGSERDAPATARARPRPVLVPGARTGPITIDGRIDEPDSQAAPRSNR